jgi:hypothetical protein
VDFDFDSPGEIGLSFQLLMLKFLKADFVLVVGMGDDVALGEYEKLLLATKTTARKELVLLHPERYVASGFTRRWLKVRGQVPVPNCNSPSLW